MSSPSVKNISVFQKRKSGYMICHPTPLEGRIMIVTNAGRDAMDATASGAQWDRRAGFPVSDRPARGRTALLTVFARTRRIARGPARPLARRARMAKSCGPDAPTLASSVAEMHPAQPGLRCIVNPQGDGGKKARSPGSNCVLRRPVIGRPQGWRWRAPAFGG
jgi:hypothetical protein